MARLPIKITKRKDVAVILTFSDGIKAWIYAKDDPHIARIHKLPTTEAAIERAKELARLWSKSDKPSQDSQFYPSSPDSPLVSVRVR